MTMKTRGVLAYLLLAFGLAWSAIFVARLLLGLSLENSLVQIPIAFSPAIAAVIVRRWITREGFGDAGLALHLRSGWVYYLAAWLFPLIAVGMVIGLATVLGISRPDLSQLGTLFPGVQLPGWVELPAPHGCAHPYDAPVLGRRVRLERLLAGPVTEP